MSFKEFPKWKYGKTDSLIVEDADAESALGDGWYNSPSELQDALDAKAKQIDDEQRALRLSSGGAAIGSDNGTPITEREALKAAADKLGLTYPVNIPSAKLEELIKEKIQANGE